MLSIQTFTTRGLIVKAPSTSKLVVLEGLVLSHIGVSKTAFSVSTTSVVTKTVGSEKRLLVGIVKLSEYFSAAVCIAIGNVDQLQRGRRGRLSADGYRKCSIKRGFQTPVTLHHTSALRS